MKNTLNLKILFQEIIIKVKNTNKIYVCIIQLN